MSRKERIGVALATMDMAASDLVGLMKDSRPVELMMLHEALAKLRESAAIVRQIERTSGVRADSVS